MEQDKLIQALQRECRALSSLHEEEAKHEMIIAGLIGKVMYELQDQKSNPHRVFPENDYGSIATQVINNPNAADKRKWSSESWPRYAIRISKWVGWQVQASDLRTAFELQKTR